MATTSRTWTYADLEELPETNEFRYEIIDGELFVSPAPVPPHGLLGSELNLRFGTFVKAGRLGRVIGDHVEVRLPTGETVQPDLLFIARDRLGIVGEKAIEGPPDLVLEILSPSTRGRDLGAKKALYERFGVKEYWIVDRVWRSIDVLVLREDRYEPLPNEDGIARSEVLPGFAVDVAELFAEADL